VRRALSAARGLGRRPRLAALLLAGAAAAVLLLLAGAPGLTRDEAALVAGAEPAGAAQAVVAAGRAALGGIVGELRAPRAGSAVAGGALTGLLALLGAVLAGPGGLVLAPLLFWLAPRHLQAGLSATPDAAAAALALAAAWAYRRAALGRHRRDRLRAAISAGLLLGAGLALRPDAWILLAALVVHAALLRLTGRAAPPAGAEAPAGIEARLHGVPLALAAMAVIGPALLLAASPGLLADPAAGLPALVRGQLRGRGGPAPVEWLALTLPAGILAAYAGGLLHAAWRVLRAFRAHAPAEIVADDLLLVLVPVAYLAAGHLGLGAPGAGVRPWLPAAPFLALAAARALLVAAEVAWPRRARPLAAALAVLVLAPPCWAVVRAFPLGASAWSELAGGAPGAAARGLPRQDGGEAVLALLPAVNERAAPGARVFWPGIPPAALALYGRDGRLRADLAVAAAPEDADLAVVSLDGGSRDDEYRAWGALRTDRPAAGVYRDEVPLAFVYARAGAWR